MYISKLQRRRNSIPYSGVSSPRKMLPANRSFKDRTRFHHQYSVCFWRDSRQWSRASSLTRFLDQTQRRITVGRTSLWTSDQLVAETSTWQHTKLTTDEPPCPGGIWTHNLSRRAAADLRLRMRGHWDQHQQCSSIRKMMMEMDSISEYVGSFTPPDATVKLRKFYCKFRDFPHYVG